MERIKDFFSMVEVKFALASISMIIILAITSFLLVLLVSSFKRRRDAVEIKLPEIDEKKGTIIKPQFDEDQKITVELVDPSEDEITEKKVVKNDRAFIETLTMETREYIAEKGHKMDMPDVGDIDYERIKEEKAREIEAVRIEREKAAIDHLREVAKADSEEDLASLGKLDTTKN